MSSELVRVGQRPLVTIVGDKTYAQCLKSSHGHAQAQPSRTKVLYFSFTITTQTNTLPRFSLTTLFIHGTVAPTNTFTFLTFYSIFFLDNTIIIRKFYLLDNYNLFISIHFCSRIVQKVVIKCII